MGILMNSIRLIDILCLEYVLLYLVHILNCLKGNSYEEYVYVNVMYNQYVFQEI